MSSGVRVSGGRPQQGFTIVELMVAALVLAILAAMALPAFRESRRQARISTVAGELASTLAEARAAAMANPGTVTIQPLNGSWSHGWEVQGPAPRTLALSGIGDDNIQVTSSSDNFGFNRSGRVSTGAGGVQLSICDSTSRSHGRQIDINAMGRISSKKTAPGC